MSDNKKLWEILVPYMSNDNKVFLVPYHQEWDKKVESIAGGLTILRVSKGQWMNPKDSKLFKELMIPVRIYCTEEDIDKIIKITIEHYNQLAVLAYEISGNVKLVEKEEEI